MTKGKILKVIRAFCMDCLGGSYQEIENCTSPNCKLFEFRRGKDPMPSKKGFGSRLHVKKPENSEPEE